MTHNKLLPQFRINDPEECFWTIEKLSGPNKWCLYTNGGRFIYHAINDDRPVTVLIEVGLGYEMIGTAKESSFVIKQFLPLDKANPQATLDQFIIFYNDKVKSSHESNLPRRQPRSSS